MNIYLHFFRNHRALSGHRFLPVFLLAPLLLVAPLWSQSKPDPLMCTDIFSGPRDYHDCGVDKSNNAYVFVGTIRAVRPADHQEMLVDIVPEEVFLGDPGASITAITDLGVCLDPLVAGQRWFFSLRRIDGRIMIDYNMQENGPVEQWSHYIANLRRLKSLFGTGLLRGFVYDESAHGVETAIAGIDLTAVRKSDQARFSARTDDKGFYEFAPLPVGNYSIDAESPGSLRLTTTFAQVSEGSCLSLDLRGDHRAKLSGRVVDSKGQPVVAAPVLLISADASGFNTTDTNAQGAFEFDSIAPGDYVLGVRSPGASSAEFAGCGGARCRASLPTDMVFFGNTSLRSGTNVLHFAPEDHHEDVVVTLPAPVSKSSK